MKTSFLQWGIGLVGSVTIVIFAAVPSEACLFPWCFGCPPRTTAYYYGPSVACAPACPTACSPCSLCSPCSPYGGRSFFRGAFFGCPTFGCPTACNPCCPSTCPTGTGSIGTGSTGTGSFGTGGTVGGGVQLGEPSSTPEPLPSDTEPPRTYRDEQRPPSEQKDQFDTGDSPFTPREPKGFEPVPPPGDTESVNDTASGTHEAQKVPTEGLSQGDTSSEDAPETVIHQKKPAPTKPPELPQKGTQDGGDNGSGSAEAGKSKQSDNNAPHVAPAGLDAKITWQSESRPTEHTFRRTRFTRPTVPVPQVVRTNVPIKADWVPVPHGMTIVRK